MNSELETLVRRLREAKISTRRFLKLNDKKAAFEADWPNKLYDVQDLNEYSYWGIDGKDGLVLVDVDNSEMETIARSIFPETFEVESPRRKLPHFYFKVEGDSVPNRVLKLPGRKEGAGEIRAQNHYLVAPGTEIKYEDLETKEPKTGRYIILRDKPIATLSYSEFMNAVTPYLGKDPEQKLTMEQIRNGVPEGTRHAYGIRMACYLIGVQRLDEESAIFAMIEWNKKNKPPMSESDLKRMVKDAFEYIGAQPPHAPKISSGRLPSNNMYFNDEGRFEPVSFAKDLMKTYTFKTMRDNEALFVFNTRKGIYQQNGEVITKEEMMKKLDEETRKRYFEDVIFAIKASTYIDRPRTTPGAVAVENGILNVKLRELTSFDPAYFITTSLPIAYDPEAACPKTVKFLTEVVGEEQLALVQESIGYCLLNELPIHKALMLIGDGNNGKSKLLGLIKKFLGSENVSSASLQALCFNRFSIAQLHGKLANICADLPDQALTQTGVFKMLVGDDVIMAEEKFKQPFSFQNFAKLLFSTNKIPISLDETTAFFRRWNLIACNNVFIGEKCNLHILEEITTKEELSGLLNWALDGLDRLLRNGRFSTTESIEDLRSQYIRKSNSAKAFIEETLEYDSDHNATIIETDLYEKYILFCKANKLPTMPKRNFTINIQENLPQAKQTKQRILGKATPVWQFLKFQGSCPEEEEGTTDFSEKSMEKSPIKTVPSVPPDIINGNFLKVSEKENTPEGTEGTSPADRLLKVCSFCGQPITGNIQDWIGPELSDPAHLDCAAKWRQLRGSDVQKEDS